MEFFDQAMMEFNAENDEGKVRLVYAYFGVAVYWSQCIEETLSSMIWMDRFQGDGALFL